MLNNTLKIDVFVYLFEKNSNQDRFMALSKDALCKPAVILLADDDEDDLLLTRDAFVENRLQNDLRFVRNGEELIEYLTHQGAYNAENAPKPDLILLDLNMPRKDGREALRVIKSDAVLRRIPVVVFTTSKAEEDIQNSYELGVNSFITKPMSFNDMLRITKSIGDYWFQVVSLPN